MVDTTQYTSRAKTPELALRQARATILDDFEIIKDADMIQILDTVYDIKNTLKEERQLNPSADQSAPIIFGSATDWNL